MSWRQYRPINKDEFVVGGYDLAMGGEDYTACIFISKTNADVPLLYHSNETATISTNRILPVISSIRRVTGIKPVLGVERNFGGGFEIDRIMASPYALDFTMYQDRTSTMDAPKFGWSTTSATRPKMLEELKNAIDNRLLTIYDERIISEMFSFIVNKTNASWKAQAEVGMHDDLVMALAIAWQLYQTEAPPANLQNIHIPQNDFSAWG